MQEIWKFDALREDASGASKAQSAEVDSPSTMQFLGGGRGEKTPEEW